MEIQATAAKFKQASSCCEKGWVYEVEVERRSVRKERSVDAYGMMLCVNVPTASEALAPIIADGILGVCEGSDSFHYVDLCFYQHPRNALKYSLQADRT